MSNDNNDDQQPQKPPRRRAADVPKQTRDEIAELHQLDYGTRRIAKRVGLSRKMVRNILAEHKKPKPPAQSKLEPFREVIAAKVKKDLTTSRILREIKEIGYQGERTILATFVRELRAHYALKPKKKAKQRFETRPGQEMQIDWSPYRLPIGGTIILVYALGCLLCASRKLFVYFFRNERQATLFEGLALAFEYFGGCCLRVVLDNMATAVVARYGQGGKTVWHPRFLDFARHYGFEPFACHVNDPDRKGKKEKSFRLLWDDFLKSSEFDSLDDLNQKARIWLDHTPETANSRIHGTTRRVPNQAWLSEQDFLIQLPHKRFPVYEDDVRLADEDATISVRGTVYTIPPALANQAVKVRLYAEHFEVLDRQGRLAFSRRYVPDAEKGRLIIDPTHQATAQKRRPRGASRRLDQAFLKRFPSLTPFVSGLQLKMKSLTPIHIRALLRLADQYGQQTLLAAATKAQDARRFDSLAVQRILQRDCPAVADSPIAPLGGFGPVVVGEVEPASLDQFGHLDTQESKKDEDKECP